ncbi:hypothetical protein [Aliivibrio fischeri]|uniref:hypothetical protein n=1 Tax=Aliivibrio fischeri TaxID=668 RepID=UPI0007C54C53|nr:hypothetical protein [Aliivibrio fischeri]
MSNHKFFATTHPKNGCDIMVTYDENQKFVNAEYIDDEEQIDITTSIETLLQDDIDTFCK